MQNTELQLYKSTEILGDFIIILSSDGIIVHSSQNWKKYCQKHQTENALWEVGENYFNSLEKSNKFNELQCLKDVLTGVEEEKFQLSLFYTQEKIDYLSVHYQQFLFTNNSKGIILHKQLVTNKPATPSLDTEVILENMTDAFFLLDDQMKFYFLNSESEKVFQCKKEDMIGRTLWNCFPAAVGTEFYSKCNHAMEKRVTVQFKDFYAPLNNWFNVKASPVKDGGLAVYFQKNNSDYNIEAERQKIPYTDYLTNWPTRTKFEEELEKILYEKKTFSLFYINLDNFKYINTLYNHRTGDEIIKSIAKNLEKLLDQKDLVGRLDGDELVFLHLHRGDENIIHFAEKVRELFTHPIVLEDLRSITVNASIGVYSYLQGSYSVENLISFSETAMRAAKKQNGSSCCFFQPSMRVDLNRRLVIEKSLSGNVKELGFYFVVQPQINCDTGELVGVEVLSRWNHPTLGPISPIEFITIAEETGTISNLTNCLLKDVFSFINCTKNQGNIFPKTAINVTASLLSSKTFFKELFLLMEQNQISSEQIEIEITESVELTYSEITLANLITCQSKGISIALDDFGTGFSMLSYLMDYPIDKIKLDKSFVSKIGQDEKSEAVLKSLIQFVKGVGCTLLAEGVETQEESLFLQANGCPIHQGYFHDKPLLPKDFLTKYIGVSNQKKGE